MSNDLASRVGAGDRAAVAQVLNLLDARDPALQVQAVPVLDELARVDRGSTFRVGLTGAPGAGKSTLLDALIAQLRSRGLTVGIIAVDPSSVQSGGALLGDRIRAQRAAGDDGVFFRSMAARGRLGGVAAVTRAGMRVLSAAYDWVIVETVGVGQSEVEVAGLVDTLVYVAQPGAGDILQYMKAGLLELPDLFAVNKADLGPPAERTAMELKRGLAIGGPAQQSWQPPVLLVSAIEDRGIADLVDAIGRHREAQGEDARNARRRAGDLRFVLGELGSRYGSHGLRAVGGAKSLAALFEGAAASEFELIERASTLIERALREPGTMP